MGSGGEFVSLYNASVFFFVLCSSNSYSRRFRYVSLTFGIYCCKSLPFGIRFFRIGYPIKSSYGIFTTHALWFPIPGHIGINIASWQSMFLLPRFHQSYSYLWSVFLVTFSIRYLNKYRIPNWVRALSGFTLFGSSLAPIIKMIISSFCFIFFSFCTNSVVLNFSIFLCFPLYIFFPRHQLHPSYSISVLLNTCLLMKFHLYLHVQNQTNGLLGDLLAISSYRVYPVPVLHHWED